MVSNTILDKIVDKKNIRLLERKENKSFATLQQEAERMDRTFIDFAGNLKDYSDISIIAEIKKASPSKQVIRANFDPMAIAAAYNQSDVQAMSILTEEDFFQGSDEFLSNIRQITDRPLLRKDFLFDEYQLYEAKLLGADVVLLIAAMLDEQELNRMQKTAHGLGLQTLIEVHNEQELRCVLNLSDKPNALGINNRDLKTFEEDLHTTERLLDTVAIPKEICLVSESAIRTPDDLAYVSSLGIDAALIGEGFMREEDIVLAVETLRGRC